MDYTITMQQKVFKEILEKYLRDSCTPAEKALVEEWFGSIKDGERNVLSDDEERRLFDGYKNDFQKIFRDRKAKSFPLIRHRNQWIRKAAAVLIILGPLLYFYLLQYNLLSNNTSNNITEAGIKKVVNTELSALLVPLSDGSEVVLNPGSILTFRSPFENGIRAVSLEGEAFFNVAQDISSPFVVKTGQLMAKVLGTSFTVKANKRDVNIIVTVKTGKVSVQQVSAEAGINSEAEVLTPNQQAIYDIRKRSILRKDLDDPQIATGPDSLQRKRFREAPIREILQAIERTYQTKVIFEENNFKGCLLSTSIHKDENLFKRLDIICKAIGAAYKVDGVSIVVSGDSCDTAIKQ